MFIKNLKRERNKETNKQKEIKHHKHTYTLNFVVTVLWDDGLFAFHFFWLNVQGLFFYLVLFIYKFCALVISSASRNRHFFCGALKIDIDFNRQYDSLYQILIKDW
jgi:hypothetical protein